MVSTFPRTLWACVFLVSAGALFLSACDTAEDRIARADATSPASAFVKVGQDHNAAMDHILSELLAETPSYRQQVISDQSTREAYVLAKGNDFMAAHGYPTAGEAGLRQAPMPPYSLAAQALIDRLLDGMESAENSQEVSMLATEVEADIRRAKLSKAESDAVYTTASIARHSSQYWEENLPDWIDVYDGTSGGQSGEGSLVPNCWAGIAAADALGAVFGGGIGAVRGSAIAYFQAEHLGLCDS